MATEGRGLQLLRAAFGVPGYRLVRHPMYTSFVLVFAAAALLMANAFTGATGAIALGVVLVLRLRREEAMLVQRFGAEYETYAQQTGRFLPRLLG